MSCHIYFFFLKRPFSIKAKAPSPVILQAVPKLSCNAKIVNISAVPFSSNPRTEIIIPRDAKTVPPGTPGAPTANIPSKIINKAIVPKLGSEP